MIDKYSNEIKRLLTIKGNIIETLENIEHRMDDDGAPKREMKKLKNKKIKFEGKLAQVTDKIEQVYNFTNTSYPDYNKLTLKSAMV